MMKKLNVKWQVAPLALIAMSGLCAVAVAQDADAPADDGGITPEMRQRWQNMTPEQRQQMQQRWQNMTPEQRQQFLQRMQQNGGGMGGGRGGGMGGRGGMGGGMNREEMQRRMMTNSGITDTEVQETIIQFVTAQEQARQSLLDQARQLAANLNKAEVTDEERAASLAAFREAAAADKKRYATALAELDQKIKYSQDARLETYLTLAGVVGDEVQSLGGPQAIFGGGRGGGMGGRGGMGRGGRGGGRGGRGPGGQGGPGGPGGQGGPDAPPPAE